MKCAVVKLGILLCVLALVFASESSDSAYQIRQLYNGEYAFSDASYTWTNVPEFLEGASFIATPCARNRPISFDLSQPATLLVTLDGKHGAKLPPWISDGWTLHEQTLDIATSFGTVSRLVYSKSFPAGKVQLNSVDAQEMNFNVIVKVCCGEYCEHSLICIECELCNHRIIAFCNFGST